MATITSLGARLSTALLYLQKGERIADIGTDHAYLPIHLVREGIASRALAADINEGPIESARANVLSAGLADQIELLRTDGLHGVEAFCPDRILIFGMGGELIVKILSEAPWIRTPNVGLVLQPMSRAATLRRWLLDNGFSITGETVSFEDRYYQTIAAAWSGSVTEDYSEGELLLGREALREENALFFEFVRHERQVLEKILEGKRSAKNADLAEEMRLLIYLDHILEGEGKR